MAVHEPAPAAASTRRLFTLADYGILAGLMAVGAGARWLYFSGYGLGDDTIFYGMVTQILTYKTVPPGNVDNISYRFSWWFPTVLSCRLFGQSEQAMVIPILAAATLGIVVVYAFGKLLWGRAGGVIAALLLIVNPLDFAWSTMITNDVYAALTFGLVILFAARALADDDPTRRRRWWTWAGVSLWLGYHAKVSAILLFAPVAIMLWVERRRVGRDALRFFWTAGLLLCLSSLTFYTMTGDALWPFHAELSFQGLVGEPAVGHRLSSYVFWTYPRWLFYPDAAGDRVFSLYPHALIVLAVLSPFLGLRTSYAAFWWFVFVFLGMQFNIQRAGGVWISGFRNVRHMYIFVYPLILLLTGYLVGLRARFPRFGTVVLAGLIGFSAWEAVSTATKTQVAFADRRAACRFLATLPPKTIYSDFQVWTRCFHIELHGGGWNFQPLESFDRPKRRQEIAGIRVGYLVTGGGREPYYGCIDCIPRAEELDPTRWRLLKEVDGQPPSFWRPEPLRIWEAQPPPAATPDG